jgi:hypothetical protein
MHDDLDVWSLVVHYLARTLVGSFHPGIQLFHIALQMAQSFVLPEMFTTRVSLTRS